MPGESGLGTSDQPTPEKADTVGNNQEPSVPPREMSPEELDELKEEYVDTLVSRNKWLENPQAVVSTDESGSKTAPTVATELIVADNAKLEAIKAQLIAAGASVPTEIQVKVAILRKQLAERPDGSIPMSDYNKGILTQIDELEKGAQEDKQNA